MAEEKEFLYAKLEDTGIDKTIIDAIAGFFDRIADEEAERVFNLLNKHLK